MIGQQRYQDIKKIIKKLLYSYYLIDTKTDIKTDLCKKKRRRKKQVPRNSTTSLWPYLIARSLGVSPSNVLGCIDAWNESKTLTQSRNPLIHTSCSGTQPLREFLSWKSAFPCIMRICNVDEWPAIHAT